MQPPAIKIQFVSSTREGRRAYSPCSLKEGGRERERPQLSTPITRSHHVMMLCYGAFMTRNGREEGFLNSCCYAVTGKLGKHSFKFTQ